MSLCAPYSHCEAPMHPPLLYISGMYSHAPTMCLCIPRSTHGCTVGWCPCSLDPAAHKARPCNKLDSCKTGTQPPHTCCTTPDGQHCGALSSTTGLRFSCPCAATSVKASPILAAGWCSRPTIPVHQPSTHLTDRTVPTLGLLHHCGRSAQADSTITEHHTGRPVRHPSHSH